MLIEWFKFATYNEAYLKKYPQFLLSGPVLWTVVAKWLFLSVPLHYIVLNRVRVLKTSAAHSLYPNSPLVYPQYKKQNYITPGGCSEGVTGKRRENLKTLMLKNGHCHLWRQLFKRVSNHKALTGKSVVVLTDKWWLIIGRWSLMRHGRTWRFNCNHWNKL